MSLVKIPASELKTTDVLWWIGPCDGTSYSVYVDSRPYGPMTIRSHYWAEGEADPGSMTIEPDANYLAARADTDSYYFWVPPTHGQFGFDGRTCALIEPREVLVDSITLTLSDGRTQTFTRTP